MNEPLIPIIVLLIIALMVIFANAILFATLFFPWIRAFMAGAPVRVLDLLGMRLRGIPPRLVVDALVSLVHRGHPYDQRSCIAAQKLYLAQRGLIHTPQQLTDLLEKEIASQANA